MWRAEDCAIRDWFAQGRVPGTPEQLREMAPGGRPRAAEGLRQPADRARRLRGPARTRAPATATRCCATPALVAEDVREGKCTVDGRPAHLRRGGRRRGRDRGAAPRGARAPARGSEAAARAARPRTARAQVTGKALATVDASDSALGCAECGHELAPREGNYRLGSAWLELPMTEVGSHFIDPREQVGEDLRLALIPVPGLRHRARRRAVPPRRRAGVGRAPGPALSRFGASASTTAHNPPRESLTSPARGDTADVRQIAESRGRRRRAGRGRPCGRSAEVTPSSARDIGTDQQVRPARRLPAHDPLLQPRAARTRSRRGATPSRS